MKSASWAHARIILFVLTCLLPMASKANVMIHLFEWSWSDVALECEQHLGPKGYTAVQVSPPQAHIGGSQWWTRYQPQSYLLNSRSGNRDQFIDMVQRCNAAGVGIYVDLVINHMSAGQTDYPDVPYSVLDFHERNCTGIDYGNADQVWNCDLVGLKDLKTESDYVRQKIADYANDLLGIGVSGFRIDAAKHMPPADVENIVSRFNGSPYVFQEVIRASGEAVQPDMYTYIADVTEFQMERDLAAIFRGNNIASLVDFANWGGRVDSSDAVVFVANHDDQRQHPEYTLTWNDEPGKYYLAQIFMLAYPYGYPRIMSSYYFNDENQGPPANGPHTGDACGQGWVCEHRWGGIGNMVGFRAATQSNWFTSHPHTDGNNRLAFGRGGLGFVVLNNETSAWTSTFDTGMPAGTYCDVISGELVNNSCTGDLIIVDTSGLATISASGRNAVAIHIDAQVCQGDCTTGWSQAFVRGTANNWGTTAMARVNGLWEVEMDFAEGDPNGGPRFKITPEADWDEAYPDEDYLLDEGPGRYRIQFDDASKAITVTFLGNEQSSGDVQFTCTNAETYPNQSVYAIGSLTELGDWSVTDAVKLEATNYPNWSGSITLPADTDVEWKCLKREDADPSRGIEWEPGSNTSFNTGTAQSTAGGW